MERLGKYEIIRRLTVGGMAELYLARQRGPSGFEKVVVVKRLLPSLAGEEQIVRMFVNEARIAARLSHPNIAQIYDLGMAGGDYFLAMEYVAGYNLAEVQSQAHASGQPIGYDLVAYVVSRICRGLQHAHELRDGEGRPLGVVHRDVSPQNILISFAGEVKLVDFGIAKATALAAETQAGLLKGKYAYMSPEQCRNEPVDARSDLFSVGILLYELLCRRRLFRRQSEFATMRAVLEDPIPPPSAVSEDVPDALEEIVMRALSRSPADRYPDAQSFQTALEQAAAANGWKLGSPPAAEYMARLYPLRSEAADAAPPASAGPDEITQRGATRPASGDEATTPGKPVTPRRPLVEAQTVDEGTAPEIVISMSQAQAESAAPEARFGLAPEEGLGELEPEGDSERTVMTAPSFAVVDEGASPRPAFIDAKTETAPVREWRPAAPPPIPDPGERPSSSDGALIAPASLGGWPGGPGPAMPPVRVAASVSVPASPLPAPSPPRLLPAEPPSPVGGGASAIERREDPQSRLSTTVLPELHYSPKRRVLFVALVAAVTASLAVVAILVVLKLRGGAATQSYPVAVTSEPAGATVYVDGAKRFGATPLTVHGLERGRSYGLLVLLDGFVPHRGRLVIDGSAASRAVHAKLRHQGGDPATLVVTVEPSGAEVYLDGEKQGRAPVKLEVPSGLVHALVIMLDGFEEQTLQIDGLAVGEQRKVAVTLKPRQKGRKQGVERPGAPTPPQPAPPPVKGPAVKGPAVKGPAVKGPVKKGAPVETPRPTPSLRSPREGSIGEHLPKANP